ncbi:MAG TPA: hypothetical protein VKT76_14525 [Bradyrhizobium sp.]|nr:hypothetical protein [Bradyrhizobium sp.]
MTVDRLFRPSCLRSRDIPMPEQNLSKLSHMIEDALAVAVEMKEATTIYLLSMAKIGVTEKIEAAGIASPDDAE